MGWSSVNVDSPTDVSAAQLEEVRQLALEAKQLAEETGEVSSAAITIPVSAWVENTDADTVAAGFGFRADVPVEGLTGSDSTDTALAPVSLEAAKACGMAVATSTMPGAVRYYAVEKPTAELYATLRVFKAETQ